MGKVDYSKAKQAVKLLKESGVDYVLVYNDGKGCKTTIQGEYKDVSQCITGAMARVAGLIYDNGYGEYTAIGELQKMAITAAQLWYEQKEKEDGKDEI